MKGHSCSYSIRLQSDRARVPAASEYEYEKTEILRPLKLDSLFSRTGIEPKVRTLPWPSRSAVSPALAHEPSICCGESLAMQRFTSDCVPCVRNRVAVQALSCGCQPADPNRPPRTRPRSGDSNRSLTPLRGSWICDTIQPWVDTHG